MMLVSFAFPAHAGPSSYLDDLGQRLLTRRRKDPSKAGLKSLNRVGPSAKAFADPTNAEPHAVCNRQANQSFIAGSKISITN